MIYLFKVLHINRTSSLSTLWGLQLTVLWPLSHHALPQSVYRGSPVSRCKAHCVHILYAYLLCDARCVFSNALVGPIVFLLLHFDYCCTTTRQVLYYCHVFECILIESDVLSCHNQNSLLSILPMGLKILQKYSSIWWLYVQFTAMFEWQGNTDSNYPKFVAGIFATFAWLLMLSHIEYIFHPLFPLCWALLFLPHLLLLFNCPISFSCVASQSWFWWLWKKNIKYSLWQWPTEGGFCIL